MDSDPQVHSDPQVDSGPQVTGSPQLDGPSVAEDPYLILGVARNASRSEIQGAYRELKAQHDAERNAQHDADRGASPERGPAADARLERAREARALLLSPSRRRAFDHGEAGVVEGGTADAAGRVRPPTPQRRSKGPDYEVMGEDPRHRRTVQRMALMYGPLAVGALLLMLVPLGSLLGGRGGAAVPLVLLLFVATALAFQAVTALRDLRAEPMFTRGEVQRTWTKGGLLWFFRSHFLMVNRQVFVVPPEIFIQVREGELVECHHWPHTRTVLRVLLLRGDEAQQQSSEPTIPI